jgi:signal transduction histidine kinase
LVATAQSIRFLAERLRHELEEQRALLQAENGTLEVTVAPVAPEAAIAIAARVVSDHPVARGRTLEVAAAASAKPIWTDESLLVRVLVNMMKNALEATAEGGQVRAWSLPTAEGCEFRVWNATAIPHRISLQIFKRSFTTKQGQGRGLGTFSVKLFGERYLGGSVGFASNESEGTTFFLRLPERCKPPEPRA